MITETNVIDNFRIRNNLEIRNYFLSSNFFNDKLRNWNLQIRKFSHTKTKKLQQLNQLIFQEMFLILTEHFS